MHASCFTLFFFNDTATTEIYTLSLHDALPISPSALTLFYFSLVQQALIVEEEENIIKQIMIATFPVISGIKILKYHGQRGRFDTYVY